MAETGTGIPKCSDACVLSAVGVIVGLRGRPSRLISARSANICTNWKSNLLVIALDSFLPAAVPRQPHGPTTTHRRMKERSPGDKHTDHHHRRVGWTGLAEGSTVSHAPVIISRGYPLFGE